MYIQSFGLKDFRNIADLTLTFDSGINVIQGPNGAGKSSVLEGLYYLSRGRSFRTATPAHLIRHGAPCFTLHASVCEEEQGSALSLGIERSRSGSARLRVGGEKAKTLSEISEHLPTLFLDTDSHRTLASGPKVRRGLIDWGLFYADRGAFLQTWQRYQRALLQRNGALKLKETSTDFWDACLIEEGMALTEMRKHYLEALIPYFTKMWQACSGQDEDVPVLSYSQGWSLESSLEEAFVHQRDRDRQYGLTHAGPHRADVKIQVADKPAIHYLSQGQQKTLTYALALAQGQLLWAQRGRRCVYLLDDVCSELDGHHREHILQTLQGLDAQIIATLIDQDMLWGKKGHSCFDLSALMAESAG